MGESSSHETVKISSHPKIKSTIALVMILFSAIRERLESSDIPESFKGVPIALITAGLLALAFLGLTGLI